jgi:hypothetical protein
MSERVKVFVSAGRPGNSEQAAFKKSVVRAIDLAGLQPRIMSDLDNDYQNPMRGIRRVMNECSGVLIIAYPRFHIESGQELKQDENGSDKSRALVGTAFPTAWNFIEAAMAYERKLPLLIIAQMGLEKHALFEAGTDINPYWVQAEPTAPQSDRFSGCIASWKEDVETCFAAKQEASKRESKEHTSKLQDVTLLGVLGAMPWYDLIALVSTVLGALAAAATLGFKAAQGGWFSN